MFDVRVPNTERIFVSVKKSRELGGLEGMCLHVRAIPTVSSPTSSISHVSVIHKIGLQLRTAQIKTTIPFDILLLFLVAYPCFVTVDDDCS
jgi:hypothetical protein